MAESVEKLSVNEAAFGERIWQTNDVAQREAFDYYREGICASFMPLRPELARSSRGCFQASVHSHQVGEGTLNFVSATAHQVNRDSAEIAASEEDCFYLNLQLGGECQIFQNDKTKVLRSGDVGIFDSGAKFQLYHDDFPRLKVASLMLRKQHVCQILGADIEHAPLVLSHHPVYGHLMTETMKSLVDSVSWASRTDMIKLQELVISLIGLCVQNQEDQTERNGRSKGQLAKIKSIIRTRCSKPGFNVSDCAKESSLSPRYIHYLFESEEDSFGTYLIRERLNLAAGMLRSPSFAHLPASAIGFNSGFKDSSHFFRTFRACYGMTPSNWRNL